MEHTVRGGERRQYAEAVTDLWEGLGGVLARLERIAEQPAHDVVEEGFGELPSLQYHLHVAAEVACGFVPPAGGESTHDELVAALVQARDATAQVVFATEEGDETVVEQTLPEWRGALFRVRLARLRALERLAVPVRHGSVPGEPASVRDRGSAAAAIAATCLAIAGAFLFTAGAVLAAWPVWAAGLALFAGGFVLFRP